MNGQDFWYAYLGRYICAPDDSPRRSFGRAYTHRVNEAGTRLNDGMWAFITETSAVLRAPIVPEQALPAHVKVLWQFEGEAGWTKGCNSSFDLKQSLLRAAPEQDFLFVEFAKSDGAVWNNLTVTTSSSAVYFCGKTLTMVDANFVRKIERSVRAAKLPPKILAQTAELLNQRMRDPDGFLDEKLDEIEKKHPAVLDVALRFLDGNLAEQRAVTRALAERSGNQATGTPSYA